MNPEEPKDQAQPAPSQDQVPTEGVTIESVTASVTSTTIATTGKRQAFRNIRRSLEESELANPGVQRILLEELERAETECDALQGYIERFHAADKRAAVLEERLRTEKSIEILFAIGLSVGSVLIGFTPSLWDKSVKGPAALVIGAVLILGATVARIIKK